MVTTKIKHIDGELVLPLDGIIDEFGLIEGEKVTISSIKNEGKKYLIIQKE